jgi:hypothetical protein
MLLTTSPDTHAHLAGAAAVLLVAPALPGGLPAPLRIFWWPCMC